MTTVKIERAFIHLRSHHFPYLDLSQNVKIRDVPYSLKSPRNSECKVAHIYGMNKGKVFMSCVLYTNGYVNYFRLNTNIPFES
jgi:hypothetical protein